jgi:BirA family transcriptional regulator, biotin operon repressor / biotin---[acetyl-CoA-carboxylase] ligase
MTGHDERHPLVAARLRASLAGEVRIYEELGSTNAEAAALALDGADQGLMVVSEHQTAGRGRLDRRWEAPPRSAVTFSMVLRPQVAIDHWPWLPLLTGYAVFRALASIGIDASLKWPNDVLLDERKVAGILVERIDTARGPAAVLGIGLNVSMREDELPVPTATSLLLATGIAPDRTELLIRLGQELMTTYADWSPDPSRAPATSALRAAYTSACGTLGRTVRADLPNGESVTGHASGIDRAGRLVLVTPLGERAIGAGDVVHIRPAE